MNKRLLTTLILFVFAFLQNQTAIAAPKYKLKGKVLDASDYQILLLLSDNSSKSKVLNSSGNFSFQRLSKRELKGASLQLINSNGQYAGPVVLNGKGSQVSLNFNGKTTSELEVNLGKIQVLDGYAKLKKRPKFRIHGAASVKANEGKPLGAGELGVVSSLNVSSVKTLADETDQDLDGIPDTFDADDDGDLVLDSTDSDSEGAEIPYSGLYFDFRKTLNAHVRSGLSTELIDSVVSGENIFSLTFFFSLPSDSAVDSGHVVCADSLTYCRKDSPLAFYGGVSESSDDFKNRPWSELLNEGGFPKMEKIDVHGNPAMVASIQPRVGRDVFRAGDVYQVALAVGNNVVSEHSLALSPYFVSVPALKEYNAGFGTVAVDYASVGPVSGSVPGASEGDPIILSSTGELAVTYWRPQRESIGSETEDYYDWGALNYGIIIESAQATCAGFYTNLPSDLTEREDALGEGNSPFSYQGAVLNPLIDSQTDRAANVANTLGFTVNLKDCLARAGLNAGTYRLALSATGTELTGGSNTSAQSIYVQIP